MAPERLEGRTADVRSDIFSFGVTLYEMIARQRPFSSPNCVPAFQGGDLPPKFVHFNVRH